MHPSSRAFKTVIASSRSSHPKSHRERDVPPARTALTSAAEGDSLPASCAYVITQHTRRQSPSSSPATKALARSTPTATARSSPSYTARALDRHRITRRHGAYKNIHHHRARHHHRAHAPNRARARVRTRARHIGIPIARTPIAFAHRVHAPRGRRRRISLYRSVCVCVCSVYSKPRITILP
jgi:hypothetical protein